MKDVRELQVVQIRLYPVGAIQLEQLGAPTVMAALEETFKFRTSGLDSLFPGAGMAGPVAMIPMQGGEFTDKEGQRVVIRSLEIGPRRTVTRVAGDSAQADDFFDQFVRLVAELVPSMQDSLATVIYKGEETTCVVTLENLDFARLFRPKVASFFKRRLASAASEPEIKASTGPVRFTTQIQYDVRDERIKENGITLNPKDFVIEPRAGTPLSSRVYFTKSPLPSDEHLQVVEEFEASVR